MKIRAALSAVIILWATLGLAGPVSASSNPLQDQIDTVLLEHPGGIQTSWNEVTWNDGEIVLTLAPEASSGTRAAVGSCANGTYCVYSRPGMAGNKLAFTTCGPHSVSALNASVRSVANARSSGNVLGRNGSTTVLTVAANTTTNTTATITQVNC